MDDMGEIDATTGKPQIILEYNKTKSGVDTVDQKCASYTTQRITRRWPLALFFRMLDIVFNSNRPSESHPRRRKFLCQLGFDLIEEHLKQRATIQTLPKDITEFLLKYRLPVESPASERRTGRCYICSAHKNTKTTVTCNSCEKFVCKSHSNKTVQCHNCLNPPMEED